MPDIDRDEAFGILVVHQLNTLYRDSDHTVEAACCADCCAACGVIRDLAANDDDLEQAIASAPAHLAAPWLNSGRIDRTWLASRWDCTSRPRCERTS